MKLKSFLLMALAASTTLAACDKSEESGTNPDKTPKRVTVTLPNIDQTRAAGEALGANQAALANFKIFFLNDAGVVQDVPQYNGQNQTVYFDATNLPTADEVKEDGNGKTYTYHFLPAATTKVVVLGNVGNAEYSAAIAKVYDVLNDGDADIETTTDGKHPLYPLYGDATLTPKAGEDEDQHENVYEATVTMAPKVARFEVYAFEYKLPEGATETTTFSYESLKLNKIALGNYYKQYKLNDGAAQGNKVASPTVSTEIWDWIDNAGTPWANKFAESFNVAQNATVNVDANEAGEAIAADAEGKIITYGLTKVDAAANNPELLLSFYGVNTGKQDTPHYVRGKFTNVEAITPGKIYRVLYTIPEGSWQDPERCVELTVKVANWQIVTVTPEF